MTTDNGRFTDENGMLWTWWYICPYCGEPLCTEAWADRLNIGETIGCDSCHIDVTVDDATMCLYDENGTRA